MEPYLKKRIIDSLEFLINEIEESSIIGTDGVPSHECGYYNEPEKGYCKFCDQYWESLQLLCELRGQDFSELIKNRLG